MNYLYIICIWVLVFSFLMMRRLLSKNSGEQENWELLIVVWILCGLLFVFAYAWRGIFEEIKYLNV